MVLVQRYNWMWGSIVNVLEQSLATFIVLELFATFITASKKYSSKHIGALVLSTLLQMRPLT